MEAKIKDFIVDFFLSREKFQGKNANEMSSINFTESNLLDSIEFITLISEVEENFNILFTEEDLQSELFSSINGITDLAIQRSKKQEKR